jgi:hypothetical protein
MKGVPIAAENAKVLSTFAHLRRVHLQKVRKQLIFGEIVNLKRWAVFHYLFLAHMPTGIKI